MNFEHTQDEHLMNFEFKKSKNQKVKIDFQNFNVPPERFGDNLNYLLCYLKLQSFKGSKFSKSQKVKKSKYWSLAFDFLNFWCFENLSFCVLQFRNPKYSYWALFSNMQNAVIVRARTLIIDENQCLGRKWFWPILIFWLFDFLFTRVLLNSRSSRVGFHGSARS